MNKLVYINLDDAIDRRERVERTIGRYCRDHNIECQRFPAIKPQSTPAKLKIGQLGCWLSHFHAIQGDRERSGHLHLVEDDVEFSPQTLPLVNWVLENRLRDVNWDLFYTDVTIPQVADMLLLYSAYKKYQATRELGVLDLQGVVFAGTMSYMVNEKSKDKVLFLLQRNGLKDVPLDLAYRTLIWKKELIAYSSFPFLSTDSDLGLSSQIQNADTQMTDFYWSSFRRLVWIGADAGAVRQDIANRVRSDFYSIREDTLGEIIKGVMSSNFVLK